MEPNAVKRSHQVLPWGRIASTLFLALKFPVCDPRYLAAAGIVRSTFAIVEVVAHTVFSREGSITSGGVQVSL